MAFMPVPSTALRLLLIFPAISHSISIASAGTEASKKQVNDSVCNASFTENSDTSLMVGGRHNHVVHSSLPSDDDSLARDAEQQCGIWFAKSTIPGAGLGVFAGRDFAKGQELLASGDIVTPIVDLLMHHPENENDFLWFDYTWSSASLFMDHEGVHDVHGASPGMGAAVNSILDLANIHESIPEYDEAGLARGDPGAGAFSPYHNRRTFAKVNIQAGQELLEDYGDDWFTSRTHELGYLPISGDYEKAQKLLDRFNALSKLLPKMEMLRDIWNIFVLNNPIKSESRTFPALPTTWNEIVETMEKGLLAYKNEQHSVSLNWLKDHGICGDNLVAKQSSLPHSGRGAFAHRPLKECSIVALIPMIHLPNRGVLDMYKVENKTFIDRTTVIAKQLLLNYCMGHNQSTLLLCPYGALTTLINHNQTRANVKLQWASPERSNHEPTWLNMTVDQLGKIQTARLSMELVALRDIQEGEEIMLDYGNEWEMAWQQHLNSFDYSFSSYLSAPHFNADLAKPLRTVFDILQYGSPYPENVQVICSLAFSQPDSVWMPQWQVGAIMDFIDQTNENWRPCEIVNRQVDGNSNYWYTVVVRNFEDINDFRKFSRVPREAIRFLDRPFMSNLFWSRSFRHDMRVPEELFPHSWKNAPSATIR